MLYPIISCEFKFDDPSQHCAHCLKGRQNECDKFQEGPVRGLALGTGVTTMNGKDLGGGFSSALIAHKNQFIPLPEGMNPQLAVLTDAYACAINGVEPVKDQLQGDGRPPRVLIIGLGPIGFSVMDILKQIVVPEGSVDVLAKYQFQANVISEYGYTPKDTTTGNGYQIVFDCIGSEKSMHDARRSITPGGYFVELGLPTNVTIPLDDVNYHAPFWATFEQTRKAVSALRNIQIWYRRLVNTSFSLMDANEAFFGKDESIKRAIRLRPNAAQYVTGVRW